LNCVLKHIPVFCMSLRVFAPLREKQKNYQLDNQPQNCKIKFKLKRFRVLARHLDYANQEHNQKFRRKPKSTE
jgi:hypothetical protein